LGMAGKPAIPDRIKLKLIGSFVLTSNDNSSNAESA